MNKTIDTNKLKPGATFAVRGNVTFSRIAKQIKGEALEADIARQRQLGRIPTTKPYTTISICNAQVVFKDPAGATDPNKRTLEEAYALERMYTSAKHPGMNFSGKNTKHDALPFVSIRQADGTTAERIRISEELATGLDVILMFRVFSNQSANLGISLDNIVLNEPVRYYSNVDLSDYGLTFVDNTTDEAVPVDDATDVNQQQPVTPPAGDPYSTQPVQPVPGAAQVPPPTGYVPQQAAPGSGVPTGYPQAPGTAVPPAPGPYGQEPPSGGIRYNPGTDPARQY